MDVKWHRGEPWVFSPSEMSATFLWGMLSGAICSAPVWLSLGYHLLRPQKAINGRNKSGSRISQNCDIRWLLENRPCL